MQFRTRFVFNYMSHKQEVKPVQKSDNFSYIDNKNYRRRDDAITFCQVSFL